MTWFADGDNCVWYPGSHRLGSQLRAIGWLDGDHDFPRGAVDQSFFEQLKGLAERPFEPIVTAGFHSCEICQFPEAHGTSTLIVPGKGLLYICPQLIVHYIAAHSYLPPADFQLAVAECPDLRTAEYRMAYLENGGRELQTAIKEFAANIGE